MKLRTLVAAVLAPTLIVSLAACAKTEPPATTAAPTELTELTEHTEAEIIELTLADGDILCDSPAVYTAHDILYYEDGHGSAYGEGSAEEAHTAEEAAAHTVVHITAPGTYHVTGALNRGQLLIDLGDGAETDENARVTLILDDASINCTVAPAVLFYNVYECADKETFTLTPDLTDAGAVVVLHDASNISGSHVAKIYKDGTTDKLYKFDGAFYSRQSLRIEGDGMLNITADNEGLDSELHLQIDSGTISIVSQDDGINTNEDGISVTTLNGGKVTVSGGNGTEGDGIDSNGALVINGGTLYASANPETGDGGIDADLGIYLNGGTVIATGSRNDEISGDSKQTLMDMTFAQTVKKGAVLALSENGKEVFSFTAEREFRALVLSVPALQQEVPYTLTVDGEVQQHGGENSSMKPGAPDGQIPSPTDGNPPEKPEGDPPAAIDGDGIDLPPQYFTTPSDITPGEQKPTPPAGDPPAKPDGQKPGTPDNRLPGDMEALSKEFTVTAENHTFCNICAAK